MRDGLPPRGEVFNGRAMLLSFDVDCGELVPGHHFIARGLGGPFRLPIPDDWDGDVTEHAEMLELLEAGGYPGFTLEYELVPGVAAARGGDSLFGYLIGVSYHADVELPWWPNDGGTIAPFEGGDATHGFRGDWPLPPNATVLTFSIGGAGPAGTFEEESPAGDLVVDLARGSAAWRPC
jgi:hypothetical protein